MSRATREDPCELCGQTGRDKEHAHIVAGGVKYVKGCRCKVNMAWLCKWKCHRMCSLLPRTLNTGRTHPMRKQVPRHPLPLRPRCRRRPYRSQSPRPKNTSLVTSRCIQACGLILSIFVIFPRSATGLVASNSAENA